jgi:hypothetical protein
MNADRFLAGPGCLNIRILLTTMFSSWQSSVRSSPTTRGWPSTRNSAAEVFRSRTFSLTRSPASARRSWIKPARNTGSWIAVLMIVLELDSDSEGSGTCGEIHRDTQRNTIPPGGLTFSGFPYFLSRPSRCGEPLRVGWAYQVGPADRCRHRRDWEQILRIWVKTAAILLALRLLYLFLEYHPEWLR